MARRSRPTFWHMCEPPTRGAAAARQSWRERLEGWSAAASSDGSALPGVVYVVVALKLVLYVYVFERWARAAAPLLSEEFFRRFLVYNALGDVLGANATWGPLAFRLKFPVVTWYNLLKPGTFCRPLVPGAPWRRRPWQCVGYLVLVALLVRALQKGAGPAEVRPAVALLAVLAPFDFVTFSALRGEHYGYMLVCCCFEESVAGCQLVQAALWFFAGTSKWGPWFAHLNQFMMPNGLATMLTDALGVLRYTDLYADHPRDRAPSKLVRRLAAFGCAAEMLLAPLAMFAPRYGVPLALSFHAYIISMMPFASVTEWNVACAYFCVFLFKEHPFDARAVIALDWRLQLFLAVVLFVVPVVGQLNPKRVPFLTAYRPYAGNWCFSWHVVAEAAVPKLDALDVLDGTVRTEKNARFLWSANPDLCDQLEAYVTALLLSLPGYRALLPIVEELSGDRDVRVINQEAFCNHVFGHCLGTGYLVKDGYAAALAAACGFERGECYLVVCEPAGLLDHTVEWYAVDVATGEKKVHGAAPYAALERLQPCAMTRAQLEEWSVLK